MRRAVALVSVLVLMLTGVAYASSTTRSPDSFALTASAAQIYVGDTVTITATTTKHGNSYQDGWSGATGSTAESGGYYVSIASVTPSEAGTLTVTYSIEMWSAKGNNNSDSADLNKWTATGTVEVQVLARPSTCGNIKNGVVMGKGKGYLKCTPE